MDFALSTGYGSDANPVENYNFGSDVLVTGDANTPPTISDTPVTSVGSVFSGIHNLLGGIATIARDTGTIVGETRRIRDTAATQYQSANNAAYTGNKGATWWQYASTTDKVMIGIGVLGLLLVLKGK